MNLFGIDNANKWKIDLNCVCEKGKKHGGGGEGKQKMPRLTISQFCFFYLHSMVQSWWWMLPIGMWCGYGDTLLMISAGMPSMRAALGVAVMFAWFSLVVMALIIAIDEVGCTSDQSKTVVEGALSCFPFIELSQIKLCCGCGCCFEPACAFGSLASSMIRRWLPPTTICTLFLSELAAIANALLFALFADVAADGAATTNLLVSIGLNAFSFECRLIVVGSGLWLLLLLIWPVQESSSRGMPPAAIECSPILPNSDSADVDGVVVAVDVDDIDMLSPFIVRLWLSFEFDWLL